VERGVYIIANDRFIDQAIALLSSLREVDPLIPVVMVPFDGRHGEVARVLQHAFDVRLFPDSGVLEKITRDVNEIFPDGFLALPNKLRKLAFWFGPFDEFVYVDTDILLFRSVNETLAYLDGADFVSCDHHFRGGLRKVFSEVVRERRLFTDQELLDVFNSGFWASRKGIFTYEQLLSVLRDCAAHHEYFDFSTGLTDQPLLNYLVLGNIKRRVNIVKIDPKETGSWAGSLHFQERDGKLYDGDRLLRYLHWAGTPMRAGAPYWDLWRSYRFRKVSEPSRGE